MCIGHAHHVVTDVCNRHARKFIAPCALGAQHGGVDHAGAAIRLGRQGRWPALADFTAAKRRFRPVDGLNDIEQRNLSRFACETIAAVGTGDGYEQLRSGQRLEMLEQITFRDAVKTRPAPCRARWHRPGAATVRSRSESPTRRRQLIFIIVSNLYIMDMTISMI